MKNLKRIVVALIFGTISMAGYGQASEIREIEPFNALQADGLVQVYLEEGERESLRLEVKGIELADILTSVKDNVLTVKTEGDYNGEDIKVYVVYRQLNEIGVAGASKVFGRDPIKAKKLTVVTTDAGDAFLDVDVDMLKVDMTGAGNLTVSGRAVKTNLKTCESGTLERSGLNTMK